MRISDWSSDVCSSDLLLRRGYDKVMVTCVIQAGSSLGILIPPSVVLVLYAMIARQPVLQLWLAGVVPGLMMAVIFAVYISVRCRSEEHTSELQSLMRISYAVFCLKKKKNRQTLSPHNK